MNECMSKGYVEFGLLELLVLKNVLKLNDVLSGLPTNINSFGVIFDVQHYGRGTTAG